MGKLTQIINISGFNYLCTISDENAARQFVMLRNYNISDGIVKDNDIYFIDKELYDKWLDDGFNLIFPAGTGYSDNVAGFNPDIQKDYANNYIYNLYDESGNITGIKCRTVKIYHPENKKSLNAIIHLHNYVNNIHFHYLCVKMKDCRVYSEEEIKYNHVIYSEYIKLYMPDLRSLFSVNSDIRDIIYYDEDLYNVEWEGEETARVPVGSLILPSTAENRSGYTVQTYKDSDNFNHKIQEYPLDVTVYPFSRIDDQTGLYIPDTSLTQATAVFIEQKKFRLMARMGFDNGSCCIITKWDFPDKDFFKKIWEGDDIYKKYYSPVALSYLDYYNIDPYMYSHKYLMDEYLALIEGINNLTEHKLTDIDKKQLESYYGTAEYDKFKNNPSETLSRWKKMKTESIIAEMEDNDDAGNIKEGHAFVGYIVEMASDIFFKKIIYRSEAPVDFSEDSPGFPIDDFSFNLQGVFKSYDEMPRILNVRTRFTDKVAGITMQSNPVVITKEWIKYIIGHDTGEENPNKIPELHNENKEYVNMNIINISDGDKENFNFLDNVHITLKKENTGQTVTGRSSTSPRTLIRPVFYRAADGMNIRIRDGYIQNIGIALGDYMTKVDVFHLHIDGNDFTETGRNDVYIIFNVDAGKISASAGYYDISDAEGNYITTGNYTIY